MEKRCGGEVVAGCGGSEVEVVAGCVGGEVEVVAGCVGGEVGVVAMLVDELELASRAAVVDSATVVVVPAEAVVWVVSVGCSTTDSTQVPLD